RLVGVETLPSLIEGRDFEPGPKAQMSGIGLQRTRQELQQGRLAGPVGADEADAVAAQDAAGKAAHEHALAVALFEVPRLDHKLAGLGRAGSLQNGRSFGAPFGAETLAHALQLAEA